MKQPTELRIRIYKFAMQNIIDTLHAEPSSRPEPRDPTTRLPVRFKIAPLYSGALALPHTSFTLRAESLDPLEPLVVARVEELSDLIFFRSICGQTFLDSERQVTCPRVWVDNIRESMKRDNTARQLRLSGAIMDTNWVSVGRLN